MNEQVSSLLTLQEQDVRLDELHRRIAALSPERDALKTRMAALEKSFEDSKKALTQAQVSKKNLELDIEAKEQAIRKNSGELGAVKSNDAYKALLSQIEEAKKAKAALEDSVLELMETMDRYQKDAKAGESRLKEDKAAIQASLDDVARRESALKEEAAEAEKERAARVASLSPELQRTYESIRRGRRGVKVAVPVVNGTCGGCRMTLPARVINDIMKSADILNVCETCSRVLYIPPENTVAESDVKEAGTV